MEEKHTTIAAVSTPPGSGGISSVRISGNNAFKAVSTIFRCKKNFIDIDSHTITYGKIVNKDEKTIDEVLVLKMKAPATYTREDVVEIQCHGNSVIVSDILNGLFNQGVLPAQPGQFTKRAFMNGRIDLSQAEAVMDVINSTTKKSERSAIKQLEGRTGARIKEIRKLIIELLSHISVTIDYPEYEDEAISLDKAMIQTEKIKTEIQNLINNFETGKILREGLDVAVIGPPNAGKSTFINSVTGEEKAIVTHIPGTTRDVLEIHFSLKGFHIVLHDTAGIRKTDDFIEKIGIKKSKQTRDKSQVVVMVLDAVRGLDKETKSLIDESDSEKTIYAVNKTDAGDFFPFKDYIRDVDVIGCSFLNNRGTDEVLEAIYSKISKPGIETEGIAVTNQRHKMHIDNALKHIEEAIKAGGENGFLDILSIDLTYSAEELGKITGESAGEDIIENIFKNFCVGK